MGGVPDWETWIRDQLAGPGRAALRAHRRARLGRALLTAISLLSTAVLLAGLAVALVSDRPPRPTETNVQNHR